MNILQTWDGMARALDSPLDPTLKCCLQGHQDRLSEWEGDYELSALATFVILAAGDTLEQADSALDRPLVNDGHFALLPELIERHGAWLEATFILSDAGEGIVLLIEQGPTTDPRLTAAFRNAVADNDSATFG